MFDPSKHEPLPRLPCGSPKLGVLVPRDGSECLDLVSTSHCPDFRVAPQNWGFTILGFETGPIAFPQNSEFPSMTSAPRELVDACRARYRAIPHRPFSSFGFAWACPLVPLAGRSIARRVGTDIRRAPCPIRRAWSGSIVQPLYRVAHGL
jgi:hypothetical protein